MTKFIDSNDVTTNNEQSEDYFVTASLLVDL